MRLALAQAQRSFQGGEVPVGAVLVRAGASAQPVLACAHNQPIGLHDPSAHAEILALREGARKLQNYRLDDCELFVTLEPCAMCAQALLHARVKRVVYGAREPKTGAAGSVLDLFALPQLNHHTQVQGGVLERECAELLRRFFQQRRQVQRQQAEPLREDALRTPESAFAPIVSCFPQWQHNHVYHRDLTGLKGLRLHCLDAGPKQRQARLFLHGPGQWWPQGAGWAQRQLQAHQRILMPDLIGHGQSDKPKKAAWHSLPAHASVLWALLDAQGVERVELVVAPGQMQLAHCMVGQARERVSGLQALAQAECSTLPPAWLQAPFPDAGHQAALKAWKIGQWDQDSAEPGE